MTSLFLLLLLFSLVTAYDPISLNKRKQQQQQKEQVLQPHPNQDQTPEKSDLVDFDLEYDFDPTSPRFRDQLLLRATSEDICTESGRSCKFPFVDTTDGTKYTTCATTKAPDGSTDKLWCATKLAKGTNKFTPKAGSTDGWGFCQLCRSACSSKTECTSDLTPCQLPFINSADGKLYDSCADTADTRCPTALSDKGIYTKNDTNNGVCASCPGDPSADPFLITLDQFKAAVKALFPHRHGIECDYQSLVKHTPDSGITTIRELAMFLAQVAHESSIKPIKELCWRKSCCNNAYKSNLDKEGQCYYGRGLIQLTWAKNYQAASQALFKDDRLLETPDLVLERDTAWATAAWYWQTRVHSLAGVTDGKFGMTTRGINGGQCKYDKEDYKKLATDRYNKYVKILKLWLPNEAPKSTGCWPDASCPCPKP